MAEYPHNPDESITGGFVYRGAKFPKMVGRYVFADFISGHLFNIDAGTSGSSTLTVKFSIASGISPVSFAEDASGEILVVDYAGGGLYELSGQ